MRNLQPYNNDSRDFIDKVISNCKSVEKKLLCKKLVDTHCEYIDEYDKSFADNQLEDLVGNHPALSEIGAETFKSLYDYDRAAIAKLRHCLLTNENGYENDYCPICEVNLVQTMDHFIPKAQYPLFAVHPKNLIPSCQTCNQHKSEKILDDSGKRYYWNTFLDVVPTAEFLHCRIIEQNGLPSAKFFLQQGTIDNDVFQLIKNTMEGQKVLETYESGSKAEIQNFIKYAVRYVTRDKCTHTLAYCIQQISDEHDLWAENNSWKDVLGKALLKSPIFSKCLKEELKRHVIPFKE